MLNYTPCDEIKSLFIDVSEEIENNNLKKFIFTSLKLNNFEINKNDFLHINLGVNYSSFKVCKPIYYFLNKQFLQVTNPFFF